MPWLSGNAVDAVSDLLALIAGLDSTANDTPSRTAAETPDASSRPGHASH